MKRIALLIGNSQYIYCNRLKNPVKDIYSMKELLEQAGFEVLLYNDLDYKTMRTVIDAFGQKLEKYDCGLAFYAGHGIQVDGINYLVPIDSNVIDMCQVDYQCVRTDQILSWMNNNTDKTNILILDACRDNPFNRCTARDIGQDGFAPMNAPKGTFISFSTSPGKGAYDGMEDNSPFMIAINKYLLTPNLKIEDVFKLIRSEVLSITSNRQMPWETTSLIGDFYFIRKPISQAEVEITPDIVYEYMESIWDSYEKKYYEDKAEALVFIDASEHFNIPIIEVVRNYSIVNNENAGIRVSNEEIDVLTLRRLKDIGFQEKYYRWSYDGKNVKVGEPLQIPSSLESQQPEQGKEINVTIKIDYLFELDKFYIKGKTNLPNETELMVSLIGDSLKYYAQSKVIVNSGDFISAGFTRNGEKLLGGNYIVEISSPTTSVQPESVKDAVGNRGKNLVGEFIQFDLIYGNTIKYCKNLDIN